MTGAPSVATKIIFVNVIDFAVKKSFRTLKIDSPLGSVFKVFANSNCSNISSPLINRTYANNNASLPGKVYLSS